MLHPHFMTRLVSLTAGVGMLLTAFTQNTNHNTYQCKIILNTVDASVHVIRLYCVLK